MFNHKKPPRIKIRVIILAILIVLILAAVVFNFTIEKDNKSTQKTSQENTNPTPNTNQISPKNPPRTSTPASQPPPKPASATTPQTVQPQAPTPPPILPSVTASQLQNMLQKSPEMNKLPSSTKLIIQFHNDRNQFTGYKFFIGSGGSVSGYAGQDYDMLLTININTIPGLESSTTVCSDIKNIIKSGKAWVIEQSSNPFVIMKYLLIKGCVM